MTGTVPCHLSTWSFDTSIAVRTFCSRSLARRSLSLACIVCSVGFFACVCGDIAVELRFLAVANRSLRVLYVQFSSHLSKGSVLHKFSVFFLVVFVPSVIAAVKCIIHSPRALSDQFFWGSKHFLVPRPSHQVRVSCGTQADISSSVFSECCLSFSFPLVVYCFSSVSASFCKRCLCIACSEEANVLLLVLVFLLRDCSIRLI